MITRRNTLIILYCIFNVIQCTLGKSNLPNIEASESFLNSLRPGQYVSSYNINITARRNTFEGRAIIRVVIYNSQTRGIPVKLNFEELTLKSVHVGVVNLNNPQLVNNVTVSNNILTMTPNAVSSTYMFDIVYSGTIRNNSIGLYKGLYSNGSTYLAMNLNPIHARKVFPCMDNPMYASEISVNFNCENHRYISGNSINGGTPNHASFASIYTPPHLWGMVAHNLFNININNTNFTIHARVENQNHYVQDVVQTILHLLNEWTNMPYFNIQRGQEEILHLFALPDMTRDWYALSTISIWEPYILTKSDFSMHQRQLVLNAVLEGLSRQWFGYVIYPQNWKYSWITQGLSMTAAYEVAAKVDSALDMEGVFLTDVIHESMLKDSFSNSEALEPYERLFSENKISKYLNGIMQYKAAAIFRTLKLVLNKEIDMINYLARTLLQHRALNHINTFHFYDAINSKWFFLEKIFIDDVKSFLNPYIHKPGYAIMNVFLRPGGVLLTQTLFCFTCESDYNDEDECENKKIDEDVIFELPITYTTGSVVNFDDIYPHLMMMKNNSILEVDLGNDDWIIFNIQGQGYYRVNYDTMLWERIIEALNNENRINIHYLNRASLLDDVLNLARAGKQSYDIAFRVVLGMQFELEYTPWKSFIRNMNFIKKQLLAYIDQDPYNTAADIYTRVLAKTLSYFEKEIGFYPNNLYFEEPMIVKTRGLVMDHACRADYQPCVNTAHNLFFADSNNTEINSEIPSDLRPAVFCSKIREGDNDVAELLWQYYFRETSHYERVVILEAFACSRDKELIVNLLEETLDDTGRFGMQERVLFFEAVAESNLESAIVAFIFLRQNLNEIRIKYGGVENLNRIISKLSENLVTDYLVESFNTWIEAINTDLGDAEEPARIALSRARENLIWREKYLEEVYFWIYNNVPIEETTTTEITTTETTTTETTTTEASTTEATTTEPTTTEPTTTEPTTLEPTTTEATTTEPTTLEPTTTEATTTEPTTTEPTTTEPTTMEPTTTEPTTLEPTTTEATTTKPTTMDPTTTEPTTTEAIN